MEDTPFSPIEAVGLGHNSGLLLGCGYDGRPPSFCNSLLKFPISSIDNRPSKKALE